ncbi:MAG: methyltransferase domain-containing protein [Pseudomonadales bacterium]|nr:methyltransferase domain-containing protein [Pseudomonadales bacterium]
MNIDTFFTDHWKEIEPERIARYEEMFVWHDAQRLLVEGAEIAEGHEVVDLGTGPGFFASGLAQIVGSSGRVHGVDINATFIESARARFAGQDNMTFHHVEDHKLPFAKGEVDRVICKNVLEYVPDLAATLAEVHRVTAPGGRAHVIDSDWGFLVVEPWSTETITEFFQAASPAFREPYIGRRVAGALKNAGFARVQVKLSPFVDQSGRGLNVLRNMASYIETFDTMPKARVEALLAEVEQSLAEDKFLFVLPQFLVTAFKE